MVITPTVLFAATAGSAIVGTFMSKLFDAAKANDISSLSDISKPTLVQPLCIIDSTLKGQPYTKDLMMTALSMFSGHYLRAAETVMDVNAIHTMRVFDQLNPERSLGGKDVSNWVGDFFNSAEAKKGFEEYGEGLDGLSKPVQTESPTLLVKVIDQAEGVGFEAKDNVERIHEAESLAVGKTLTVKGASRTEDGEKVGGSSSFNVTIRLVPSFMKPVSLAHMLTAPAKDKGFFTRLHLWRSGQIKFIRDVVLNVDGWDAHAKALVNDNTNVYKDISDRRRTNTLKSIFSGTPSLNDASNILIMSKETAQRVEKEMYGKLSSPGNRQKIFDSTFLFFMMIVDEKWEQVTIYHRNLNLPTQLTFSEMKSKESGKGPDITEIMKAIALGNTPSI